jgi:hypothetical protein
VFKSTNGGATWGPPVNAFGGDKQWIAVDTTNGPGRGNVYQHWNVQFSSVPNTSFTRSTNGGASYENPTTGPNPYSKWGTMGHLFARSTNAQFAGQTPTFTSQAISLGGITTGGNAAVNPGGLLGQVSVAAANNGNLYVLGSVNPPGADPLDVMFIRSTDGGTSWSTPVRINNNPAGQNSYQWFGAMSVAPNGRIDAIWNDTGVQATRLRRRSRTWWVFRRKTRSAIITTSSRTISAPMWCFQRRLRAARMCTTCGLRPFPSRT